jgi:hypothetical protein
MDIDSETTNDELFNFENLNNLESTSSVMNMSSETEDDLNYKGFDNDNIYSGSNVKVEDLALSFILLCKKFNIPVNAKDTLLDFIRNIVPVINKIPCSYRKLIKNLSFNAVRKKNKLCSVCLLEHFQCPKSIKKLSIFEIDIEKQLPCFVRKNWLTITSYKGNNFIHF